MFNELLYKKTFDILKSTKLKNYANYFQNKIEKNIFCKQNFDQYIHWSKIYRSLPDIEINKSEIDFVSFSSIKVGTNKCKYLNIKNNEKNLYKFEKFEKILKKYMPWRKGPFDIFGIFIDAEWKSNLKWDRIINKISSLKNKIVLDIGAGNGYYSFKMYGHGAKIVIGIEPSPIFISQFLLFQKYINEPFIANFPLKTEDLPNDMNVFDTVFSMGVLYHRISPIEHLEKLYSFLKKGGELVLETLVSTRDDYDVIFPENTYSKMPNVWFIPSIKMLTLWLKRLGFKNIRCVDVSITTTEEQRKTEWMVFDSLGEFLDKNDRTKTFEGYQLPTRAVFLANK